MISKITMDYERYKLGFLKSVIDSRFRCVLSSRINMYISSNISTKLATVLHNRDRRKYNVDIYPDSEIGGGFYIVHLGSIVIGSGVKLGNNVSVQSCVTLGEKFPGSGFPKVGDNVYIGTGAKILGDISIGNNVTVGANAVVINDVPDNTIVAGIPAKIIREVL